MQTPFPPPPFLQLGLGLYMENKIHKVTSRPRPKLQFEQFREQTHLERFLRKLARQKGWMTIILRDCRFNIFL